MKVAELAKEFNTTSRAILATLKSLKLKAIDSEQELNSVVITVLRSELKKRKDLPPPVKEEMREKKEESITQADDGVKKVKKVAKKAVKKSVNEKEAVAEEGNKGNQKIVKAKEVATVKKSVVKKTVAQTKEKVVIEEEKKESSENKTIAKIDKKATVKTQPRISRAPVITLKPLSRRRKKMPQGAEEKKADAQHEGTSDVSSVTSGKTIDKSVATPVVNQIIKRNESLPDIEIQVPITVKDLSVKLQQKPSIVLKSLMKMGILCHINQGLDADIVSRITQEFGFNLTKIRTQEEQLIEEHKIEEDDAQSLKPRAPVITFMGHVDHGKTTLLDKIRKSKIADAEHGGITQHIGAYSVSMPKGRITFLDTPGHEAFTAMRARGAHITDIVVLIVAADEGIMPQTREAIDHAKAANVPIIVAITKIDRNNADIDRVKKQFSEIGLLAEDWGGKTIMAGVSAVTGEGVDELLELILLEAEMLELKANDQKKASGIVVEAHLSQGKGAVTTLIVQSGTLFEGEFLVLGPYYGKIRAMFDDCGHSIREAGPSMPIEILGLSSVPDAGEKFYVIEDERQAKQIALRRQEQLKNKKLHAYQKITLEDLQTQISEGVVKELNVILKADTQGSVEALKDSLEKIPSDKVKVRFIHSAVGDINASDVLLAVASKAIIIAFHVGADTRAKEEMEKEPVDVRHYRIIYDAVNDMKNALEGLLEIKTRKNFVGRVEIREVFKLSKQGIIAGCYVAKGKVRRKISVDVIRGEEVIFSGELGSLKRFKDDVKEVTEGMECGIAVAGFDKIQAGDFLEVYDVERITQKL